VFGICLEFGFWGRGSRDAAGSLGRCSPWAPGEWSLEMTVEIPLEFLLHVLFSGTLLPIVLKLDSTKQMAPIVFPTPITPIWSGLEPHGEGWSIRVPLESLIIILVDATMSNHSGYEHIGLVPRRL
jgi:hypothetical protein